MESRLEAMGMQALDSVSSREDGGAHYPVWEDVRVSQSTRIVSRCAI